MDKQKQMIKNYFIILQQCKFNRKKAVYLYYKYENILDKPFFDCLFDFDNEDKFILDNFTNEVEKNAESVFDAKLNGNILFYKSFNSPIKNSGKLGTFFPPVLFYKGNLNLLNMKSISMVGTRNPSDVGAHNAERIAKCLIKNNLVIVSGLAKGIDQISHETAKKYKYYNVIGVIGTPINRCYPKENSSLQKFVSDKGLLISEYASFESTTKLSFLRRNYIMSSVSNATVVVEAGDTSGSINQARYTLNDGKKVIVPRGVFNDPSNSWPQKFRKDFGLVFEFQNFEELQNLLSEV